MKFSKKLSSLAVVGMFALSSNASAGPPACADLNIDYDSFKVAANDAYEATLGLGFDLGMWATLIDTQGQVCHVYSVDDLGPNGGANAGNTAWLGSRVISAQKANTANAFSLDGPFSIPTGAVSIAVYPGGSLYGLQHSNPVDATVAYAGNRNNFGTGNDPLVGQVPGGVNVFGGGIAIYNNDGKKIGSVGVSGDTSCRDAAMAYNLRHQLAINYLNIDDTTGDELAIVLGPLDDLYQQPICLPDDSSAGKWPASAVEAASESLGVYFLDNS